MGELLCNRNYSAIILKSAVGVSETNISSKLIFDFKKGDCKEKFSKTKYRQKTCMQHEGCYKCHIRNPVRMCAITQKENKAIQKTLVHLPGKVKKTVAANSLTSKKMETLFK